MSFFYFKICSTRVYGFIFLGFSFIKRMFLVGSFNTFEITRALFTQIDHSNFISENDGLQLTGVV